MMSQHFTRQSLEERYWALDDVRQQHVGLDKEPKACRSCYALYAKEGCFCGRDEWTMVTVVVAEIGLLLDRMNQESRNCTGDENCVHCKGIVHTTKPQKVV